MLRLHARCDLSTSALTHPRSDRSGSKLQKQSVPLLIDFKPGQNRKILQVESGASCLPSSWGRRASDEMMFRLCNWKLTTFAAASTVCLSVEGAKGGEVEHVAFERCDV